MVGALEAILRIISKNVKLLNVINYILLIIVQYTYLLAITIQITEYNNLLLFIVLKLQHIILL